MSNRNLETSDEYITKYDNTKIEGLKSVADREISPTTCNSDSDAKEDLVDIEKEEKNNEERERKEKSEEEEEEEEGTEDENDDPGIITELHYQGHNIETIKDNSKAFEIRGLAVTKTPGNILVCDHGNHCIKYVDNLFNVVNRYPVVYEPCDVAVVDDTYAVVTFPFVRLMQYLKFKNKSRLVPWFPVKSQNEYYGVCADRDKIIATCKYNEETRSSVPSVHVLDRQGNVDNVIDKGGKGENIFVDPNHIALNSFTQIIYVSDQGSKEVISLSISGTVLARFVSMFFNPRGVTVDNSNGNVFVSNQESVIHLNSNLRRIQTIKCKEDIMHDVFALTYCSKTDRLIVNMDGSPLFRVFVI